MKIIKFVALYGLTLLTVSLFIYYLPNDIILKYVPVMITGAIGYFLFHRWFVHIIAILLVALTGIFLCIHNLASTLSLLVPLPEIILFSLSGYIIVLCIMHIVKKEHLGRNIPAVLLTTAITVALTVSGALDQGTVWAESSIYAQTRGWHVTGLEFGAPLDYYVVNAEDRQGSQHGFRVSSYEISEFRGEA